MDFKKFITLVIILVLFIGSDLTAYSYDDTEFMLSAVVKLQTEGRNPEAISLLNRLYAENPKNINILVALTDYYINNNNLLMANKYLKKLTDLKVNNSQTYSLSARIYLKIYDYQHAEIMARKALDLNYKNKSAYLALGNAYLMLSKAYVNKEELLQKSLEAYQKLLSYNDASAEGHVGLGKVYLAMGRNQKAYDEMLKAYELAIDDTDVMYELGKFYSEVGESDKSIRIFNKYLSLVKNPDEKTLLLIAQVYEKLGDMDNAKKFYLRVIKINPNNYAAKQRSFDLINFTAGNENFKIDNIIPVAAFKPQNKNHVQEKQLIEAYNLLFYGRYLEGRDKLTSILTDDPANFLAVAALCEYYYLKWQEKDFNSSQYVSDVNYIEKNEDSPGDRISRLKFEQVNKSDIPEEMKNSLLNSFSYDTPDIWEKFNYMRSLYIKKDFPAARSSLNEILVSGVSSNDILMMAFFLYADGDYYDSLDIISQLDSSFSIDSYSDRVKLKIKEADEVVNTAVQLYNDKNKKKMSQNKAISLKLFNKAFSCFPSSKKAYYYYADVLYKMGNYTQAYNAFKQYYILDKLYPSQPYFVSRKKLDKMLYKYKLKAELGGK